MAPHTATDTVTDTAIALLRGVNVGGRGILPMHALAALLEALGARQVRTYIQSGNAVFEPPTNALAPLAWLAAMALASWGAVLWLGRRPAR